ncbi:MAG TPA: efflux RND transporter periplasmic adaptor subunit [Gemmatimonadaceae bacterium]|nr:efflux RND transporter periplasmic adaptor subunit [Gemmatimonadaceae bacterium]
MTICPEAIMPTLCRRVSVAALLWTAACSKPAPQPPPAPPPEPVIVTTVTRGPAPTVVTANGTVEPMQTANVAAQVSGLVTRVSFREGDMVRRGQILFRIDPRPYAAALAQAEAALARDEAQAASALHDADRYAALVTHDYVTRSQAESMRAAANALAATVDADRAAIASARFNLENTVIRAPISGRTGGVLVREGNLVQANPGQPLVVINQIDPIHVRFDLPATAFPDVQRYSRGRTLPVRVVPADGGVDTLSGRLTFLDNAIDTTTRTVQLKGEFANSRGQLWPGQLVAVTLQLDVQPDALLVPSAAVQAGQQGDYVFVVDTASRAVMRPVGVGRTVGDAAVVTQGLSDGERVVVDGQSRLGPGARVRITTQQAASQVAERTAERTAERGAP